ncbi:hypothetical protein [Curtobacterium sp. MCBD17_040]|uniref:hypothetical protein n=1 Tax=Curtobacterium sp. MCBD17_040 TaxID=2175674 RepID=UPI000DA842DA|nr:hypothetical protein [Curtobacterium sp. MCBD17_040]WIB65832.1 hypothetical protein DEI94_17105 [Curtobacterium sp. MCBD17_040]
MSISKPKHKNQVGQPTENGGHFASKDRIDDVTVTLIPSTPAAVAETEVWPEPVMVGNRTYYGQPGDPNGPVQILPDGSELHAGDRIRHQQAAVGLMSPGPATEGVAGKHPDEPDGPLYLMKENSGYVSYLHINHGGTLELVQRGSDTEPDAASKERARRAVAIMTARKAEHDARVATMRDAITDAAASAPTDVTENGAAGWAQFNVQAVLQQAEVQPASWLAWQAEQAAASTEKWLNAHPDHTASEAEFRRGYAQAATAVAAALRDLG